MPSETMDSPSFFSNELSFHDERQLGYWNTDGSHKCYEHFCPKHQQQHSGLGITSLLGENPSEKDVNQGTAVVVVSNFESTISMMNSAKSFGGYGEIKEVNASIFFRYGSRTLPHLQQRSISLEVLLTLDNGTVLSARFSGRPPLSPMWKVHFTMDIIRVPSRLALDLFQTIKIVLLISIRNFPGSMTKGHIARPSELQENQFWQGQLGTPLNGMRLFLAPQKIGTVFLLDSIICGTVRLAHSLKASCGQTHLHLSMEHATGYAAESHDTPAFNSLGSLGGLNIPGSLCVTELTPNSMFLCNGGKDSVHSQNVQNASSNQTFFMVSPRGQLSSVLSPLSLRTKRPENSSLMNEDKRCRPMLFHSDGPNAGDQEPFLMGANVRSRSRIKNQVAASKASKKSYQILTTRKNFIMETHVQILVLLGTRIEKSIVLELNFE
ncbi:hypothetical protein Leryth_017237 [Lithospermum erythrorhizon]|nr:hypothetical protein Leryth_017237 [Lithospermum erythrorhizon]